MIKCNNWLVGFCSWSIGDDLTRINEIRDKLGVESIHLHAVPALKEGGEKFLAEITGKGWNISSMMVSYPQEDYSTLESIKVTGGIVPDDCWPENLKLTLDSIDLTASLNVDYLSLHFGFIDPANADLMAKFIDRVKLIADAAAEKKVTLLMETGQESADELSEFLEDLNHPALGVNFDPANMILYDKGNPVEAVKTLAPWIKHVHIKDAVKTETPGTWGLEVPWGAGQVNPDAFLLALKEINYSGALAIEREAGDDRFGDIKIAVEKLKDYAG